MRMSGWMLGLLVVLIASGASFGMGYYVAKQEAHAPAPQFDDIALDSSAGNPDTHAHPTAPKGPELTEQLDPEATATKPESGTEESADATSQANNSSDDESSKPQTDDASNARNRMQDAANVLRTRLEGDAAGLAIDATELLGGPQVDLVATITGTVVDGNGAPVAGAQVHGDFSQTHTAGSGSVRYMLAATGRERGARLATTNGAGEFRIDVNRKVSENATLRVSLTASEQGYADSAPQSVMLKNGDIKDGITLALRPAGSVSGRVVDQFGRGVQGISVSLSASSGLASGWQIASFGADAKLSAITDAAGEYRIERVAQGTYRLQVRGAGYREVSGPSQIESKPGTDVRAPADFVVAAVASVRVALQLLSGETTTFNMVILNFKNAEGKAVKKLTGPTDAEGVFTANEPPVGNFTVDIIVLGFQPVTVAAYVNEGLVCDLGTVTLQKAEKADLPSGINLPD
jgi:protocatechuate 3,4-dioxygenase beta subunit